MLQQSITVGAGNPWDSFEAHGAWPNRVGGHVVGLVRVKLDNPTITELPINMSPNVPASEVQGMAEALRRHYQSEETADTLEERDRSLPMPPRTVGDANPQLTGWLAQVAQSHGKLTLDPPPLPANVPPPTAAPDTPSPGTTTNAGNVDPDQLRRADSGKFDHGGAQQTKALAEAYKNDPVPETTDVAASTGGGSMPALAAFLVAASFGAVAPDKAKAVLVGSPLERAMQEIAKDPSKLALYESGPGTLVTGYATTWNWPFRERRILKDVLTMKNRDGDIVEIGKLVVKKLYDDKAPRIYVFAHNGKYFPLTQIEMLFGENAWQSGDVPQHKEGWEAWFDIMPEKDVRAATPESLRAMKYGTFMGGLAVIGTYKVTQKVLEKYATDGAFKFVFKAVGNVVELVIEARQAAKGAKVLKNAAKDGGKIKMTLEGLKDLARQYEIDLNDAWVKKGPENIWAAIKHAIKVKNLPDVSDWQAHLIGLGGDALGRKLPRVIKGVTEHAHHIVQQGLKDLDSKAAQRILEKWDIDWYTGAENLVWAVNRGFANHTPAYRKVVRKLLEDADSQGRDRVVKTLKQLGELFAADKTDWSAWARSLNLIN